MERDRARCHAGRHRHYQQSQADLALHQSKRMTPPLLMRFYGSPSTSTSSWWCFNDNVVPAFLRPRAIFQCVSFGSTTSRGETLDSR
jgi:hypothetical protein